MTRQRDAVVDHARRVLSEHVPMSLRRFIRRRRLAFWEFQIGKQKNLEFRVQPGVRMELYLDSRLSRLIYCGGYEWRERKFLNAFLRQGDIFVDVGANIGLFTLIAADRVGNNGHVYAFEPCLETYQRLARNVQLNGLTNVSLHQLALSDSVCQHRMKTSLDGYDAWNSLGQPIAGSSFASQIVDSVRWDDFALDHGLVGGVAIMKIDVEGWETRVLSGGAEVLSRTDAPVLQVEFTEEASRSAGSSCARLYETLHALGYEMFTYDAKSRKLIHVSFSERYAYLNLIAAKQPEEVAARLRNWSSFGTFGKCVNRIWELSHARSNPK